jgi:hypothetical protein
MGLSRPHRRADDSASIGVAIPGRGAALTQDEIGLFTVSALFGSAFRHHPGIMR